MSFLHTQNSPHRRVFYSRVVELVQHHAVNVDIAGSSPALGALIKNSIRLLMCAGFLFPKQIWYNDHIMRYILFLVSLILTGFLGWGVFAHAEAAPVLFTRDLRVGTRGTDVRALQQFLNNQDTPVAIAGPGSRGQETDYFGVRTQQALARYQERHADSILKPLGLNKGSGLFLQATRNQINASNKMVTIPPVTTTSTNVVGYILGGQISGLRLGGRAQSR